VVPPRRCRVLLNTPRILKNRAPPRRGCLDNDDPFFLDEKSYRFLPWFQHSPSQIYIRVFQPVTRYTNIILESGLWVELGCVLLHETNKVDN
jgi:hypothetical protein